MQRLFLVAVSVAAMISTLVPAASASPAPAEPLIGVYRWDAPSGPEAVEEYSRWLGRDVDLALAFEAQATWDDVAGQDWQLRPWSTWLRERPGRKLVLSVPMLPGPPDGSGPTRGSGPLGPVSLAAGARGEYDEAFVRLARNLVRHDMQDDVYLRIGHEFNAGWYAWAADGDEAEYAAYWRHIVDSMRSVVDADWQFVWNPNAGLPVSEASYPGDDYVDVVGVDAYDVSWVQDSYPIPAGASSADAARRRERAWTSVSSGYYGLSFFADFARDRAKPLALVEWGVWDRQDGHGGGDNPRYIEGMADFIDDPANGVAFASYFDVDAHDGDHQLSPSAGRRTSFPRAAEAFRDRFGAEAAPETGDVTGDAEGGAVPDPTPPPVPAPAPTPGVEAPPTPTPYEAAVATSRATHPDGADTVLVSAAGGGSSAPHQDPAGMRGSEPVLVVPAAGALPAPVVDELTRLAPSSIVVVGPSGSVGDDVVEQLAAIAPVTVRTDGGEAAVAQATASGSLLGASPVEGDALRGSASGGQVVLAVAAAALVASSGAGALVVALRRGAGGRRRVRGARQAPC